MKLNDKACRNAKPKDKPYKMADGGGLYLYVQTDGARYWRLKYRFLGKEKVLALGVYPIVGLADARIARDQAKRQLAAGKDPFIVKKDDRRQAIQRHKNSFEIVAREWHENQTEKWTERYALTTMRKLEADIFPYIGRRPISDIDAPELLDVLRKIEKREAYYYAGRMKQICGQVFRYGIATGRCQRDLGADLKGALKTAKTEHFPALDIREIPEFIRKLEKNDARLYARTRRAVRLLMLTFTRTSELINATWDEFDFENARWEIPAARMKMGNPHIVPLSQQAIKILQEQKEETGHFNTPWIFPSQNNPKDPMSNATILGAIKRIGYKGRMTGHGFRALAMTTIKENLGYRHEVVDRQLAHAPRNKVDRAYDRAKFFDEREKMMQEWADYIDTVVSSGKVVVGSFGKAA